MSGDLVEAVALAICEDAGMVHQCKEACALCKVDARKAIALIRPATLEEAAAHFDNNDFYNGKRVVYELRALAQKEMT